MKTFRFIGMALLAIVMCVNFASCSDDDEEEQGETYSIEGTWLLQSSGTTLTVTPHIMDCWDTAEIKSLDKTKLVLECVGDDGNENWYTLDTYVRAK